MDKEKNKRERGLQIVQRQHEIRAASELGTFRRWVMMMRMINMMRRMMILMMMEGRGGVGGVIQTSKQHKVPSMLRNLKMFQSIKVDFFFFSSLDSKC